MRINLDHCVIHVSDWERSNEFYRDVLGAEIIPRGDGFAYRLGNAQLNCHGPNVNHSPVAQLPVRQHGIAVEVGPVPRFGSQGHGTSVYFRDPDSSLLEFISYSA